jgi:hypothetical protein
MSKGVRLTAGKLLTALVCGALLCSLFVAFSSYAAPNPTINYQGKLTNTSGVAVPNGTYNMRFYLYDNTATGATSTAIWSEKLIGADKVQVTNGLFSVMLGSTTPFTGVDFNQTLYLGVEIGGSTTPAWDGEMSPRKVLGTVPAAFVAYDALDSAALGGVASSSFLRSDQADTASGLLSFTGGFISSASSTINSLTFGTATGTTLVINGDTITDFTGLGLVMDGTSLKVATDTLNIAISDTTGTLTVARGGTGSTTPSGFLFGDGAGALDSVYSISSSYIEDVFLRNNADDTTTGKLTIGGGLLSLASSTIGDGTPGGGLTINGNGTSTGTFVAPTYMTTGGVALGAGWTRESIWNNSIGALSGTYGLTTDQTNFRELTAPNVFESASTWEISATTLQNGSVLIAYRDSGNGGFGTFAIYDPAGNEVKAPTVFEGAETYDIAATTLQNGNVLMAYRDVGNGGFGTFAIYDPSGNEVKAPTVFESASTYEISATTLQNGNVLMAYRDTGNSNFGTFAIYDPSGNEVKAPTVFESASTWEISATTLQNGSVLIAYRDSGNSNFGTFAIYDPAGNEVKAPTVFEGAETYDIAATTLQNGSVLMAYRDSGNGGFGTFAIYDPSGNEVKAPTVFESASTWEISATTLQNGNVLMAYRDTGNSNFGTFAIYDPAGNVVKVPTVFESASTWEISATTLQNGNVLIAYRDFGNSNFGTFAIWGSAGAEFTDRLAVTTDTEQAYDLFAINGSSSSSTINATQLGTGDIFNFANSGGEVLTLTNTGYLGLGTTSPLARLTVGSSTLDKLSVGELYRSQFIAGQLEVDGTAYFDSEIVVAGSATSTFEGPVTTGALTASSTITAPTYMTTGGVALGAGWTREGIWNNSIGALSGTYGLTTDQTNFREVIAPTVFESAGTDYISATTLQNGNVLMAYRDTGNSNFGTFAIYDPAGNEVKAPTVFESASTWEISATTLQNGSVLIAYRDSGNSSFGTFAIYDPAGNEVKAPTVFESAGTDYISATTLQNGNVLMAYRDVGNGGFGTFAIYDPSGNEVKAPTVFESASTWEISATTLQNGNVALAYRDNGNSDFGTFAIYDPAGNEVKAPTVFESASTYEISATTLQNGNVLIAYNGNSSFGTFAIYDPAGNVVKAPTVFESAITSNISATTLQNGNVLIAYRDVGNSSFGTFAIYDPAGNEVKAPTVFESASTWEISATTLQNGNVALAYRDNGNSNFGTFAIWGSAGAEFTDRLAVTTDTEQAYDLFAINGSSSSSTINATQLGTGDIFNFANSGGEVLTLTNTGYLGLGTTSPLARLTVGSSTLDKLSVGELYRSQFIAGQLEVDGTAYFDSEIVVAGSATSTFEGPVTTGALTASSTITAPTYMTTGGVALGVGWTREGIWNNSIGALSGTYGLTTDQTNFRELTAPNVFESAVTEAISATTLQNGNVLIAYRDNGNSDFGTFAIYDPAGNVVKAPTVFASATTYDISATTLQNGNVLMAYSDTGNSNFGTFAIYDPAGNVVKAPTVFESAITSNISATTLQNGNVLIAYRDFGNSDFGTFAIYDPAGNVVKAPTVFASATTYDISATTLQNGNVLIAYRDFGNNDFGTFAIYDPAGNEVKTPTVFGSVFTWNISATTLQNGNVLIAYADNDNSNFGTFTIYDPAGNIVKAPTVFESAYATHISATTLQNGNVLIAYNGNSSFGTLVIYDPAGNEVKAPTVFEIGNTLNVSVTTLQNGNVLIAYRDGGNSNFGTFAIWGSAGAEFTDRLAVTTETEQAYDLFAINGSSSSSTINATQLGTGDILTLDNATKRVLTVTNDGFLGLGAVSTRLFTVSGATNAGGRFIDETNSVTTEIRSEDNQGFIGTMSDHDLRFITNGSSRAALTNNGNFGLGTTSPMSKLSLQVDSFTGTGTAGFSNFITTTNSSEGAVQFGNYSYLTASNTATTTLVANLFRIQDDTDFDNTVRGLEVQTDRGINAGGENTALSGVARTFGVRGITRGNAGGSVEPAGGYFATEGTDSGNAIRGYSNSITTASLLALFQDSSDFEGTGLEMSFGNAGGTFSSSTSRYLDFQNNGSSVFTVSGSGTTTIGNGVAQAGLQIMNGGLCVDNGTGGGCTASTSGQISSISSYLGNSDLAETYFSRTDLLPGELISLVGGLSIDRANRADTLPVLGVVSTKPGLLLGADDSSLNEGERAYPVALTGRVPVKLSTESGPIKAGDQLMLSSLPGIAMKATGTGHIIGIALEDFDDTRKYSDTYLNQFGDDMVDPIFEPILTNNDPRINDGCYFGGGVDIGEAPCVPLTSTTSMGRIDEANELAEQDSIEAQLEALREEESETVTLDDDTEVQVGQIVMFVEREERLIDRPTLAALSVLMGAASTTGEHKAETVFDRMVALANGFVDGVLSILELQVDRVEVKEELCVDGRCFSELEQRVLELEAQLQELSTQATVVETEPEPESTSEVEIPATEDSTTGVDGADLVVESVSGEEGVEIVPEIPAAETVETEALLDGQTTEDSTTVIVEEETAVEGEVSRLSEPIESQEAESVPEEGVEEQSISDPVEVVSEPEPASAEVEVVADDGLFEGE